MQPTLTSFLSYTKVPETNFAMGQWYEAQGHDSPAISFYLRAAEFADNYNNEDLLHLAYEALLRAHICIDRQRTRELTSKYILQRAIALLPNRPEAHYLLALFHERRAQWPEAYLHICSAYEFFFSEESYPSLRTNIGIDGAHSILIRRVLSSYHWGRGTEARVLLQEILNNHKLLLSAEEAKLVNNLVTRWGVGTPDVADVPYISAEHKENLKWQFANVEEVARNFSQCFQDMFILTVLDGKKHGTYLEIGSEDPVYKSNTYLLEKDFSWRGVSVEIDKPEVERFKNTRLNPVICADATKLDYTALLERVNLPSNIDYLQIDTEPSSTSFEVLLSIPFEKYKFAVVTFEHDHAIDFSRTYREKSRRYLRSLGYELIVPDIGPTDWYSFEDWWVEPTLVDVKKLDEMGMKIAPENTKRSGANDVLDYFLK